MRSRIFWLVLISLFTNLQIRAQFPEPAESHIYFFKTGIIKNKKPAHGDLKIYAGLAGLTIASYMLIDPDMQHETQENLTEWQRFSAYVITPMGSGTNTWYAVGATTVTALALKNQRLKKLFLYGQADL